MTKSKLTKKALLCSLITILLSATMLIGTTFAWFTDTASTSVNKIQAGTLTVDIVKEDGTTSIKDKSMDFVDYNNSTNILWEPGVTFKTPVFKIKSTGNLALKYKLVLNGVNGDNELLDVIKFSVISVIDGNENEVDLDTYVGHLTSDKSLSGALYIKAHMDEEAGNKYQGKSLEGLGITVVATQDTVEYDSYEKTYDENAVYPVYASAKTVSGKDTIIQDKKSNPTIKAVVPKDATTASELALIEELTETPSNIEISTGESTISLDVKIIDTQTKETITVTGESFFTIDLQIGQVDLIKFYHKDAELTKVDSKDSLTSTGLYYYDIDSGIVTYTTQSFSPFTAKIKYSGGNGSKKYPYLIDTAEQLKVALETESNKYLKLLNNMAILNIVTEEQSKERHLAPQITIKNIITLDLNGKTISVDASNNSTYGKATPVLFTVQGNDALLTINDSSIDGAGTISCEAGNQQVYGISVMDNAKLTINNGKFYGALTFAQVTTPGPIEINGGYFDLAPTCKSLNKTWAKYIINCIDSYYTQGTTITMKGGTIVGFDPSNNPEGTNTSYVADGYKVVSETKANGEIWYTVVAE